MNTYLYTFSSNGNEYYVYAPSKISAIRRYLRENRIDALPKDCVITRSNG